MFTTSQTTSQHIGSRTHQCDTTAHHEDPTTGRRAWVLLDGIGDHAATAEWVLTTAPALGRLAARLGDPTAAIEQTRARLHVERADFRGGWPPDAAAVVAVLDHQDTLTVGWAGDCRAYLAERGRVWLLTRDHNDATGQRREGRTPTPEAHDQLTSSLSFLTGAIDTVRVRLSPRPALRRLVLASDGAYLPHEHAGILPPPKPDGSSPNLNDRGFRTLALAGDLADAADYLTARAVHTDPARADNATAVVIDLTIH